MYVRSEICVLSLTDLSLRCLGVHRYMLCIAWYFGCFGECILYCSLHIYLY